ncbi:hypothetical protein KOW79_015104 [Hemibagrus wyckioides]|uniref:Uncharacterized protein n=1 Tax=Hemibagrus wyckioides TaxID=337641 RepID=A0A9D3SIU0_9TELE|nr:hypothetical protein KOW79_015104 [Hemibagrus wyckioides]
MQSVLKCQCGLNLVCRKENWSRCPLQRKKDVHSRNQVFTSRKREKDSCHGINLMMENYKAGKLESNQVTCESMVRSSSASWRGRTVR